MLSAPTKRALLHITGTGVALFALMALFGALAALFGGEQSNTAYRLGFFFGRLAFAVLAALAARSIFQRGKAIPPNS